MPVVDFINFTEVLDRVLEGDRAIVPMLMDYLDSGSPKSFHHWGMRQSAYRAFRERCYAATQISGFDLRFRDYMNDWAGDQIRSFNTLIPMLIDYADIDFDAFCSAVLEDTEISF